MFPTAYALALFFNVPSLVHVFFFVAPKDWETPKIMRPTGKKARKLLEDSLALDPNNPWAIHLYIHLMEAGSEAKLAVPPAQRLQYLVPGAPHLQVSDTVPIVNARPVLK